MIKNQCPLISVIIPFYNSRLDYFQEAIESVLAQSYTNWEIIVVNDGSNAQSKNELEKYINSLQDKRVFLLHLDKNSGPSVARNKGIELCKGEIITFLDSDDLYLPWFCEKVVNYFNKKPNYLILSSHYIFFISLFQIKRLCITKYFYDYIEDKIKKEKLFSIIKGGRGTLWPQLSLKKDVFRVIKFDPQFLRGEDTDFVLQILSREELFNKTTIAPIPGYIYRIYPSKTRLTHKKELIFNNKERLIAKHNDTKSLANKIINNWLSNPDEWKFDNHLDRFLKNGSIFKYLHEVLLSPYSIKEKIKSIRALVVLGFTHKYLTPAFGIDFQDINTLFDWKNDRYKMFKKMFDEYLITQNGGNSTYYANKLYERIF